MVRVELFGPPGVGKSTALKHLKAPLHKHWLMDANVRRVCAHRIVEAKAQKARGRALAIAQALPRVGKVWTKLICQNEYHRALGASADITSTFVEQSVQSVLQATARLDLRVKSSRDLLEAICQLAVFNEWTSDAHVILDDGSLTHFGTRFAFVKRPCDFATTFCHNMPKPDAAILFRDEPHTIVRRIRKRAAEQWVIPMHAGKTDSELLEVVRVCLAMCQAGADALRGRNVPVLEVNLAEGVAAYGPKLIVFLDERLGNGDRT